jgi:hypothetical protein
MPAAQHRVSFYRLVSKFGSSLASIRYFLQYDTSFNPETITECGDKKIVRGG